MKLTPKEIEMNNLKKYIIDNNIANSLKQQAKSLIMGEGDLAANIMFIGEAPGKKEDELGQPFVGASGKLLNQLLESIQLSRQLIYITNIVKYRPLNNRQPTEVEKQEFWPILLKQIMIIQPKVLVTLGAHALGSIKANLKISACHGQVIKLTEPQALKSKILLPLYHPAVALYNPNNKQILFDDIQVLKTII